MPSANAPQSNSLSLPRLHELPIAWRVLLTTVVVFIGAGYAAALLNIYAQNELVDGKPGLSKQDLLLKYAGGTVEVVAGEPPPSRMLEMIRGKMRENVSSDEHFRALVDWLTHGATRDGFAKGTDPTPHDVLIADCLTCHAADSGEKIAATAPFGPDMFTPDFDEVSKFTATPKPGQTTSYRPPRDWRGLALTTHAHMLSVPVFVVLLGAMFLWAGWPGGPGRGATTVRTILGAAPLVLFLVDISCWWLARIPNIGWVFALTIGTTGALFGLTFGLQWLVVIRGLWKRA